VAEAPYLFVAIDGPQFIAETFGTGTLVNHHAGKLGAFESHGLAPVGCRLLPSHIIMAALMTVDGFLFRHARSISALMVKMMAM
jgi:hypothetical protein